MSRDQIVIISLGDESFELVPKTVASKIAERNPKYVVANDIKAEQAPAEDDPYADYQIPDDLSW